jgi:hypothetical protein
LFKGNEKINLIDEVVSSLTSKPKEIEEYFPNLEEMLMISKDPCLFKTIMTN